MSKNRLGIVVLLCFLSLLPMGLRSEGLKLVETWDHGDQGIGGAVNGYQILTGGQVFVSVINNPSFLVGKQGVVPVLRPGEGPGEVGMVQAHARCGDNLACLEYPARMKVFFIKGNHFEVLRSFWLEQKSFPLMPRALVQAGGHWYAGGYRVLEEDAGHVRAALVSVYSPEGKLSASPLIWEGDPRDGNHHLRSFLAAQGDCVWFMQDGSLQVHEFSSSDGVLRRQKDLLPPPGYRPYPEHPYRAFHDQPVTTLIKGIQEIYETHSPIAALVSEDGRLLVQIISRVPGGKKYQLLVYRQADWAPSGVYPMDALLLGARDGRYYFHRGGYPGENEDSERCVIDVYTLERGA